MLTTLEKKTYKVIKVRGSKNKASCTRSAVSRGLFSLFRRGIMAPASGKARGERARLQQVQDRGTRRKRVL